MIPDKAIVAANESKQDWPSLQTQLLRLDRQIYAEVLPLFESVEVFLHSNFNNQESWREIVSALRSHILTELVVAWEQELASKTDSLSSSSSKWLSDFFLACLFTDIPHPLHSITISMRNPSFGNCLSSAGSRIYLRQPEVEALLAAAYLKRNLAIEVLVKNHQISDAEMPRWNAEQLSKCLAGTTKVNTGGDRPTIGYWALRQRIIEMIGLDLDSNVHITTDIPRKAEGQKSSVGVITFKLVADQTSPSENQL